MLAWVVPFIWASLRVLAFVLQLIGLLGVITAIVVGITIGVRAITNKILEEAEKYEYSNHV